MNPPSIRVLIESKVSQLHARKLKLDAKIEAYEELLEDFPEEEIVIKSDVYTVSKTPPAALMKDHEQKLKQRNSGVPTRVVGSTKHVNHQGKTENVIEEYIG